MTTTLTKQQTRTGPLLVIAAAILWGTTGTSQALAPAAATPLTIGALRLAIGGLALLGLALANGRLRSQTQWPIKSTFWAAVNA
ncbi:MAG: EamA family transporter, partial [Anaerolineae bacterium]